MVKSGLTDDPYVSAYRLTFHLMNALIIYGRRILNGLILLLYRAIISLFSLKRDVKNITETNVINPQKTFRKRLEI